MTDDNPIPVTIAEQNKAAADFGNTVYESTINEPVTGTFPDKQLFEAIKAYRKAAHTRFKNLVGDIQRTADDALINLACAEIKLARHINAQDAQAILESKTTPATGDKNNG